MSSALPSEISAIYSSVAGLITGILPPLTPSTNSPFMKSFVWGAFYGLVY